VGGVSFLIRNVVFLLGGFGIDLNQAGCRCAGGLPIG
jgi:hypothetical protein